MAAAATAKNDNNGRPQKNCDLDTCSISTTVPCTRGSRASSHISIPGLDWDSQVLENCRQFSTPSNFVVSTDGCNCLQISSPREINLSTAYKMTTTSVPSSLLSLFSG